MKRLCAVLLTLALTLGLFAVAATPIAQAANIVAKGIDVSVWQGSNINWTAVKNSGHGDFAILRAYCLGKDTTFDINYQRAKAAGVHLGAYCFIYGQTTAAVQNEVNGLISALQGKEFEYPIYIDVEDSNTYQYVGRQATTDLVKMACQMLESAGFYAGVYTYTSFAASYIYMNQLTDYTTWIADYRGYVGYTGSYDMWQYGCEGSVGGISPVDVNYAYVDFPSLTNPIKEMQKFDENEKLKYDPGDWKQMWHITAGRSDVEYEVAQEFRPTDTLFKGVQLYMKIGGSARVKIAIGTTQDNNNTFAGEFVIDGNQHEGWYSFDFQRDVHVTKGNLYYLRVHILSSSSYGIVYTNSNPLPSSCPIRAHIREEGKSYWGKTDKCIGFNMLTEYGMVRYPFPVDGDTLMLYDGDSTNKIETHYATQVSVDRSYRREGTAGLKLNCTNPVSQANNSVGGFALIRLSQSANLSKYNYLSYQLYLPKDMNTNSRFQVNYITNPNGEDGFNSIVNITGWKAGWHTITLRKEDIGKAVDGADWSKIYNIRLVWFNDGKDATPTYFYVDNIHASVERCQAYPYEQDDSTLVIHDGEQDRAYFTGYTTIGSLTESQATQGGKSIMMNCTNPKGQANQVGGMLFLSLDKGVDMTAYDKYSLDLYIGRDITGNHEMEFAFSSDDVNLGYSDKLQLDGFKQGWVHLVGTIDEATLRDGQVDTWTSISTIRITWYNWAQDSTATVFCVDNFKLERSSPEAKALVSVIDGLPAVDQLTLSDKAAVEAARKTYIELDDAIKSQVTNIDKLAALEAQLVVLEEQAAIEAADKAAAQIVIDKIDLLPETIALTDALAIEEARALYEHLTDVQKGYVTNYSKLQKAEADLETEKNKLPPEVVAAIENVHALIEILPAPQNVTLEHKEAIEEAKAAYEALGEYKTLVHVDCDTKLMECETVWKQLYEQHELNKANAKVVEDMIEALPDAGSVTVEDEDTILAVDDAYEALTEEAKAMVPNVDKLMQAVDALRNAIAYRDAQKVIDMINALPTPTDVTVEDEEAILEAREAYDDLSDQAKALIVLEISEKLEACEAALVVAKDKAAAKAVEELIEALVTPTDVTDEEKLPIQEAEKAFNALTDAQKGYISDANKEKLTALLNLIYAEPVPEYTLGDVNGDGKVDAKDALEVLKASVGKVTLTEVQQLAAEVDGKEGINAKDALEILKYTVGKIKQFPIELM